MDLSEDEANGVLSIIRQMDYSIVTELVAWTLAQQSLWLSIDELNLVREAFAKVEGEDEVVGSEAGELLLLTSITQQERVGLDLSDAPGHLDFVPLIDLDERAVASDSKTHRHLLVLDFGLALALELARSIIHKRGGFLCWSAFANGAGVGLISCSLLAALFDAPLKKAEDGHPKKWQSLALGHIFSHQPLVHLSSIFARKRFLK